MPEHSHRAFLLAAECDYFLDLLQENNFNVFDEVFRQGSYVKVPYQMFKAAKAGKF